MYVVKAEQVDILKLKSSISYIVCAVRAPVCAVADNSGNVVVLVNNLLSGTHTLDIREPRLAISSTGDWLAIKANNMLSLVASTDGHEVLRVDHGGRILAVQFNDSGTLIASASKDGHIRITDLISRREVIRLDSNAPVLRIAFDPAGEWLAAKVGSDTINLWRIADGFLASSIGGASNMAFSADGLRLATGTREGSISVWTWPPTALSEETCRRLHRNLTAEKWHRYMANEPQRSTCAKHLLGTLAPRTMQKIAATSLVRDYYAALDAQEVRKALGMWNAPTKRLEKLMSSIDSMRVKSVMLLAMRKKSATVAVDVVGRKRGSALENWRGTIYLTKAQQDWKIHRMSLSQRKYPFLRLNQQSL